MMMTEQITTEAQLRVLGLLVGDIHAPVSDARIKYGQLFAELGKQCRLVDVHNVELEGTDRYQNALRTLRWPKWRWQEAFYKNVWGFHRRSQKAQQHAFANRSRADVILQHGTIFSSEYQPDGPPVVVYTDFTYRLAQREDPWRDSFTDVAQSEGWNSLEAHVAKQAAFVLTRSEYVRQSMIDDYGIAPERVAAVGGGINFTTLPSPQPLADAPRILFIGTNFERKGGEQLLAAFGQVRQRVPEAELWLVTHKADITGPGIRRIEPTRDRDAMEALYRSAGVFAMPSRCETWGDVFLEAMAYGLPCIGTTNDAMPEIIEHGRTGYVVAPDDVAALAEYLERLLLDPALRQTMGAQGRERVLQTFTWEHVARRMVPYLQRAARERMINVAHRYATERV
ncbi:MAG: glycosyltransferase family 4 protein [Chloroflexi bacterium]|nr:glycosyltransferase family 4 protein [Chloroflexota bacterium]